MLSLTVAKMDKK